MVPARNATDVRALFFGPGVRLAASRMSDDSWSALQAAGICGKACLANAEQCGLERAIEARPVDLLGTEPEVELHAQQGYTLLSF